MRKRSRSTQQTLTWRAGQLSEALDSGGEQLDPTRAAGGRRLVDKVHERWELKGGRTVVALAGATGSGKSSLFNALVGAPVAQVGARRPTTATATAAIWGSEDAGPLLDWLGVPTRHQVQDSTDASLDGLVLIDLPDFDSTETAHRVEADRILERADVFVWVADPQKYADARLHEDYLQPLQDHESVMIVVLNQVDRLPDDDSVERIKADLARLVKADGAGEFTVIGTSARLFTGLTDLTDAIAVVVARRNAAEERLVGDVVGTARGLLADVAETEPSAGTVVDGQLLEALKQAAGIPVVLGAVQRDYVRQAQAHVGWPFTRWLAALRPDPLRRLRLGDDRAGEAGITPSDVRSVLGRSSLPAPSPAARSAVQLATRQVGEAAGEGLPSRWADAVAEAAAPDGSTLADSLDQAVLATPLRTRNPAWWQVGNLMQWLFALVAVLGLGWLVLVGVLGFFQINVDTPLWGPLPVPVMMLFGGLLLGLLLAGIGKVAARTGAVRRRRVIEERLEDSIGVVADEHVRRPVEGVLDRHRQTRSQLAAAAS